MKKLINNKLLLLLFILLSCFFIGCNISFKLKPDKYYKVEFYIDEELIYSESVKENNPLPEVDSSLLKSDGIFVGWDRNGDDQVDNITMVNEHLVLKAVFRENREYVVAFYCDDVLVSTNNMLPNTMVDMVSGPAKDATVQYNYSFVGWDSDNDGNPESFPYRVTGDVTFKAIYNETIRQYHYAMYDGTTLLQEETLDYGSDIIYKGIDYKIVDGKPYALLGWDSDNDGLVDEVSNIKSDLVLKAVYTDNQLLIMTVGDKVYAKYIEKNKRLEFVEIDLGSAQTIVWYTDSEFTNVLNTNQMPENNFYIYGKIEETYLIDTSLLSFVPDDSIDSKDEFLLMFDYCLFNKIFNVTLNMNFDFDSDTILNEAKTNSKVDGAYSVNMSYSPLSKKMELGFSYPTINTTSSTAVYTQYGAKGLLGYPNTRGYGFNDFYIDGVSKTYNCSNSEQLYYCLEHGYRPIISGDNVELKALYNKMKDVLRFIIDDNMSDYDKALAIYEWIIMEVTYDKKTFELAATNQKVSQYHCFYLEGVFNDKLAVCDGISKAYASLCNIEGIPCVRVTGTGSVNHAWNKIRINNNWYVVDATSGGTIINSEFEILTHKFFLITDEMYKKYYIEDGKYYNGLKALGEFNYYQNYGFKYLGNYNDFSCDNVSDMREILKWFASANQKTTCEMYINFDYGADIDDELQEAKRFTSLGNINFIMDENVLVIIKK